MVMIVEDDAVLRRGLARLFADVMFEVIQLDDGNQAMDSITNRLPDLILCDYRLPGMDGLEILGSLSARRMKTPFILITAHYSEQLSRKAAELGAVVIEKPFEISQLKAQCEKLLESESLAQKARNL